MKSFNSQKPEAFGVTVTTNAVVATALHSIAPVKTSPVLNQQGLLFSKPLHEKIDHNHLRDQRRGFLLTEREIHAVNMAIKDARTHGRTLVHIKRTHRKTEEKLKKLTELEKTLNLPYSVLIIPPDNPIALYQGKEHAIGKGQFGSVKIGQDLKTGEWVAVKIKEAHYLKLEAATTESVSENSNNNGKPAPHVNILSEEEIDLIAKGNEEMRRDREMREKKKEISAIREKEISTELGMHKGEVDIINPDTNMLHKKYIIQILIRGLDLQHCLDPEYTDQKPQNKITDLEEKLDILIALSQEVKNLHDRNILHRDIHPGNVMYDHKTKALKLIDFDTAVKLEKNQTVFIDDEPVGLLNPHEKLIEEIFDKDGQLVLGKYVFEDTKAGDIHSLGKTIELIMTNYESITNELPTSLSDNIFHLTKSMGIDNKEKAPTIDAVIDSLNLIRQGYKQSLQSKL